MVVRVGEYRSYDKVCSLDRLVMEFTVFQHFPALHQRLLFVFLQNGCDVSGYSP